MKYFYRSLLPILLASLICQNVNSCKNFFVQHCTDIPIGFNSISTIKCIQLIPIQFDLSIDYSVENYIIKKASTCYDVISYNSSLTNLFSNDCHELCPDEYCLLFDNQPNTSIINIFYSQSSAYDLTNLITNYSLSYDYFLFDSCSSNNRTNQILLIVVYVLCGIVGVLSVGVISKYFMSCGLKKGSREYSPYDWRWILDCLLCQIQPKHVRTDTSERTSNNLAFIEDNNQLKNYLGTSTQPYTITNGSSNNTHERGNYSSGNSTDQRDPGFSSELNSPAPSPRFTAEYFDFENNNTQNEASNHHHQSSILPVLHRLSSKARSVLSVLSTKHEYNVLEAKPSPEIIITRF